MPLLAVAGGDFGLDLVDKVLGWGCFAAVLVGFCGLIAWGFFSANQES